MQWHSLTSKNITTVHVHKIPILDIYKEKTDETLSFYSMLMYERKKYLYAYLPFLLDQELFLMRRTKQIWTVQFPTPLFMFFFNNRTQGSIQPPARDITCLDLVLSWERFLHQPAQMLDVKSVSYNENQYGEVFLKAVSLKFCTWEKHSCFS